MNMDSVKNMMLAGIFDALSANNTDEKILDFADINAGWHFGEGVSISAAAIRDAAKLHDTLLLCGFFETDAFPGLAGEVRVTAYYQKQYLEFTRETNGTWSYVFEVDGEVEEERDLLTMEQAQDIVRNASEKIWNTSAIFTDNIGISDCKDSKVSLSVPPATAVYPLWTNLVPYYTERYASISGNFIPLRETPPFFGYSQIRFSQTPFQSLKRQATQMTDAIGILPVFPTSNQRDFLNHTVFSQMISKSAWETNQEDSHPQTSLFDWAKSAAIKSCAAA